jgi:hypothetical protein
MVDHGTGYWHRRGTRPDHWKDRAMPSPFPGMDPYLENSSFWPDLHLALAAAISGELNHSLPRPYYAVLQVRPELGIVVDGAFRERIVRDLTVVRPSVSESKAEETTRADRQRTHISPYIEADFFVEPIRHQFIEIRDSKLAHKLITLIEILSPSNKCPGPDRESYERGQRKVLGSDASLIELDLLRSGERAIPDLSLGALLSQLEPQPHYAVILSRAWQRENGMLRYQVFPCGVREWLPCIPVPLRQGEEEVLLDLQFVFNRAYDSGPYRRAVDYSVPTSPPLSDFDTTWAQALVRDWEQAAG